MFGAEVSNERMTRDGNIYTAGGVTSGIDMALRLVGDVVGEEVARKIQLAMEYDPAPPYTGGNPYTSPPEIVAAVIEESVGRRLERERKVNAAVERLFRGAAGADRSDEVRDRGALAIPSKGATSSEHQAHRDAGPWIVRPQETG